jgi:hypothetical protein
VYNKESRDSTVLKSREGVLARDNYSYKKYARELAKKKKREEKLQRKLDKKTAGSGEKQGEASSGEAVL